MSTDSESTPAEHLFDVFIVGKRKNLVLSVDAARCKGCRICVAICPHDALYMGNIRSPRGYVNPIENGRCTGCKQCVWACPDFALSVQKLDDVIAKETTEDSAE